jgi:uncharacterized membrane protein (UPF0182 family)
MAPYYLTLDLITPQTNEFLLITPMSPLGRDNLRALAIAGCDGENYGKLFVYSFSREEQVYGPSQINALINQDTTISQQFTLWDQVDSEVIRGRMIIEPVGNVIFYIQPVYLQEASGIRIPQLKRLIMTQGDVVVMEASLEEAYRQLHMRLAQKIERKEKRFPVKAEEPPGETLEEESQAPESTNPAGGPL